MYFAGASPCVESRALLRRAGKIAGYITDSQPHGHDETPLCCALLLKIKYNSMCSFLAEKL
jgi:hypothetical protein